MSKSTAGSDWRAFDLFEFARASRSAAGTLAVGDLPRMVNEVRAVRGLARTNEAGSTGRAEGTSEGASGGTSSAAVDASLNEALNETVSWAARGELRAKIGTAAELYLHLTVEASPWVVCQRCLTPFQEPLDVSVAYLIVASEEEADAVPLDDDEADPIVGSRQFDLYELIEEEVLLSLPLVPKHTVCPSVHEALVTGEAGDIVIERPAEDEPARRDASDNPFAALQALKRDVPPKNDA
jgi:uncharacterized protein